MRRSLAVLATAALAACASTPEAPKGPEPMAEVKKLEIADQGWEGFTAVAHVALPEGFRPDGGSWELLVKEVKMASGPAQPAIEGGVAQVTGKTAYVPKEKFPELFESTEPMPILFRGELTGGGRTVPFSVAGQVRAPRVPELRVWHIEASTYPDTKEINLVFFPRIKNANPFDIDLESIGFDLEVNGKKVIEQGVTGRNEKVPASAEAQVEIPVTLHKENFPDVEKFLKSRSGLSYKLEGSFHIGLGEIPFDAEGPIDMGGSGE